ncbi:hypothetical protein LINPERPRIM_LOCUS2069 [Linum perenne]
MDNTLTSSTPKVAGLPKLMALRSKSNNNFMQYVDDKDGDYYECMGCNNHNTDVTSKLVKLEVEPSKTDESQVHIRCCFNNKYLRCSDLIAGTYWIEATAQHPEENPSKDKCTLFMIKPLFLPTDDPTKTATTTTTTIQLLHVYGDEKKLIAVANKDPEDDSVEGIVKHLDNDEGKRTYFEVYTWGTPTTPTDEKKEKEDDQEETGKKDDADDEVIERLKKEVEEKEREIKERDEVIKRKEEEMKRKDEEIAKMKKKAEDAMRNKDKDDEEIVKKKDEEIAEKKMELEEKEKRMKELEAELGSLSGKVNKLKNALRILVTSA